MPGMMFFSFRSSTRRVSLEDFWYSVSSNRICRATGKHCLPVGRCGAFKHADALSQAEYLVHHPTGAPQSRVTLMRTLQAQQSLDSGQQCHRHLFNAAAPLRNKWSNNKDHRELGTSNAECRLHPQVGIACRAALLRRQQAPRDASSARGRT